MAEPVPEEPFERTPAFVEELIIAAPAGHPPIGKNGCIPRTMIVFETGCPHRRRLEDWYAARDAMPERTIELSSYHAMLGCVAAGMGVALLPRSVLSTFPERKRLSIHTMSSDEKWAAIVLIWRKGTDSPKLQALKEMLRRTRQTSAMRSGN